jgi:hypothetical protein
VYHFDGSHALTLTVPNGLVALTTGAEHMQLTADGSKLLLGTSSLLINTDNSGIVQLGTNVNLDTSSPPNHALVHPLLYHPTMKGDGSELLYTFTDFNGAFQLAVAHLNPSRLGGDPAISNVRISPSYLLTQVRSAITVSAAVSAASTPVGVTEAFLLGGVQESGHLTDQPLSRQSDGTYANNAIAYGYDGPTGPRTVRVSAETVDGNGLQHVTSVEVSGLSVVTQAPYPTTETFVIGLDNQVYAQLFDASGSSVSGYFLASPGTIKALAVSQDGTGKPEIFVQGQDNQAYALSLDATGHALGSYFLTRPGQVKSFTLGQDGSGDPEVFVIGLDNQVYAQLFDASGISVSSYFLVQAGSVKAIVVSSDASGRPELFVLGLDNQVYASKVDASGSPVGSYFLTRPGTVKALTVGHDASHDPELFVIGMDDQVYAQKFDATGSSASAYFLTKPGGVKTLWVTR